MTKHLLALLLAAPGLAHAQTPSPYVIKGQIGQLNAPTKVYLVSGWSVLDSATLKNGTFEMKGTSEVPTEAELVLMPQGISRPKSALMSAPNRTRLFLEPGPVLVTTPDSLPNATLAGGPLTKDYQRFRLSTKSIEDRVKTFLTGYQKLTEAERNAPARQEQLQTFFRGVEKDYATQYAAFIKANPSSWVSFYALSHVGGAVPQYGTVAPLYEGLSPAIKGSVPGRKYGEMVQRIKSVSVGAPAPAFTQKTPAGKDVSLADYRGKYVLVDFWASWCGPCREENPTVTKAYNAFKTRNFDILSVSLDDEKGREKWLKAIAEDKLAWTQVSDLRGWKNEAAQRYQVQGIPQNFLIDPQGKIVAVNLRGIELEATLAQFIKK